MNSVTSLHDVQSSGPRTRLRLPTALVSTPSALAIAATFALTRVHELDHPVIDRGNEEEDVARREMHAGTAR